MRLAILTATLALAGCTASGEMQASQRARSDRELAEALEGRVAGAPQDCISAQGTNGPRIIDAGTILYSDGRRTYVNKLEASCPGLSPYDTIVIELHGSQICRNDLFRTIDPGNRIPGPYCRLAKFVPYEKPR
ncbi:DUF6491 family protein [Sphingomonas sp. M1-B02]|uniref:DUF6491 family protein n=1 Tax=Sphingomonas sp. M1-B02 TaxID=3114300 RepID=UPI0022400455|nr:DUF6491 family protein [Sphingomonas sp. S6-11]UZK65844.1 DUF6491 family protein [Sphingomonas sp. S6-11]